MLHIPTDLQKASDYFEPSAAESRLKELKAWLVQKGVRDFDKVGLYSDQLEKVSSIEYLAPGGVLTSCYFAGRCRIYRETRH